MLAMVLEELMKEGVHIVGTGVTAALAAYLIPMFKKKQIFGLD